MLFRSLKSHGADVDYGKGATGPGLSVAALLWACGIRYEPATAGSQRAAGTRSPSPITRPAGAAGSAGDSQPQRAGLEEVVEAGDDRRPGRRFPCARPGPGRCLGCLRLGGEMEVGESVGSATMMTSTRLPSASASSSLLPPRWPGIPITDVSPMARPPQHRGDLPYLPALGAERVGSARKALDQAFLEGSAVGDTDIVRRVV